MNPPEQHHRRSQRRTSLARRARAALAATALAALGACGGGVSTLEPFTPERLHVFGDELALIQPDGSKFTINALDASTTPASLACASFPVWPQYLAQSWGMAFAECNPAAQADPKAVQRSVAAGAKAADTAAALRAFAAATGLGRGDLFAVSAGQNDVLDAYAQVQAAPATFTVAMATAQVEAAADTLADAINAVAAANGRIIFTTVAELNLAPLATAAGSDGLATIASLVRAFNTRLRLRVDNNGRRIGLVKVDELMQVLHENREISGASITNTAEAACLDDGAHRGANLPACTTETLTTAATGNAGAFMWADETRITPAIHAQIGAAATNISRGNPF
jgi:hypothetical protein